MRKLLLAVLAITLSLGLGANSFAQSGSAASGGGPVLTISFAGYDQLMGNIKTATQLAGRPELGGGLEGMLMMVTQGKGLAGMDKARPWGVVVYSTADGQFPVQGFIPVTDLKQLMSVVPNPAGQPWTPDADGVYEVKGPAKTLFLLQKDKWAVLADTRDALKTVPADPSSLLGDLASRYALAVRATIKNVPAPVRDGFTSQVKMIFEMMTQQRGPGETDEQFALRSGLAKKQFEQLVTLSKELDEVMLGFGMNSSTAAAFLDFEMTALPGTQTATQFASAKESKTEFAGFLLPGAAVTGLAAGTRDENSTAQAKQILDKVRKVAIDELAANEDLSKQQRKLATELLSDTIDVLQKTAEQKTNDGGFAVILEPGAPTVVAGLIVAEGAKLDSIVKRFVEQLGKDEPEMAKMVKLNADSYEGVNFHVATVPITDENAAKALGDTAEIVVGIGENRLYLGAGKNVIKTLKLAIDNSKKEAGKAVPPLQVTIAATPIAKFYSQVVPFEQERKKAAEILEQLEKANGKDHITLVAKAIANGISLRLAVEEGLVKTGIANISLGGPGGRRPMNHNMEKKAAPSKEADPF